MSFSRPIALALLLVAQLLSACSSNDPKFEIPEVDDRLVVGCDFDNPPFASGTPEKPMGRDVDMMVRIGARFGVPIEWRRVPFPQLLNAVEQGAVDLVCATMGITAERERSVLFTQPYFVTEIVVVVRTGAGEPGTFAALAGKRVGAAVGTTSEQAVRRMLPHALCVSATKAGSTTAQLLLTGELDAAAMDGPRAAQLIAESDGRLTRIQEPLDQERYAIAVSKQRPTLRDRVNEVLTEMEKSNVQASLNAQYGL